MDLTTSNPNRLKEQIQRLQSSLENVRSKADEAVSAVVQTTEIASTGFALGMINGRFAGAEFLGVPLDLWVAGAAHGAGLMGLQPEHMHNFGDGAACSFAVTLGAGVGREMRLKALAAKSAPPAP